MKKIMMALMGVIFITTSAMAQHRQGNIIVCQHDETITKDKKTTKTTKPVKAGKYTTVNNYDQYVVVKSNKDNPRLKAHYDKPGDAYEGKEVMFNDGVAANMARNINYMDFSINKPPVDGGISDTE